MEDQVRTEVLIVGGGPKFPAKDATSVALGLRLGVERLFGKDHVFMTVLTSDAKTEDGLPTKQNIRAAFETIAQRAKPEDTLVVYLAGHGAMSSTTRDLYYYLTADARTVDINRNPQLRDVSSVSSDELFHWLREPVKSMPLKQVVILDTCAVCGGSRGKLCQRLGEDARSPRFIETVAKVGYRFICPVESSKALSAAETVPACSGPSTAFGEAQTPSAIGSPRIESVSPSPDGRDPEDAPSPVWIDKASVDTKTPP
jgi:hypothetical protein